MLTNLPSQRNQKNGGRNENHEASEYNLGAYLVPQDDAVVSSNTTMPIILVFEASLWKIYKAFPWK